MIRIRPKLSSEYSKEWRCCFCLHVRTGTILLGSWHLLLHLVALVFLAAIVRDPKLLEQLEKENEPVAMFKEMGTPLPTPLSNVEPPPSPYTQNAYPRDHSLIYNDVDMGALVTVFTLTITLMLIYGAARGKPAHLLPFFCLQIFDFAITVLTATGYMCYLRSMHRVVAETRRVPWRDELLQLPGPALAILVFTAFLIAVLLKAYCISVVWRCYKYLTMHIHAVMSPSPVLSSFLASESAIITTSGQAGQPLPGYISPAPLPDYEEAVKQSPPPSYHVAMNASANPTMAARESTPTANVTNIPDQPRQAHV